MQGWLVVNGFMNSSKFNEIYMWLKKAFEKNGHTVKVYTNTELALKKSFELLPDFVIFWDKDIVLAKRLESMGIRLFNNSRAIEICDNKALTYVMLEGKVSMPETIAVPMTYRNIGYNNTDFVKEAGKRLGYPFIIKECFGSFGQQVYMAESPVQAENIVKNTAEPLIFQKFIAESRGHDIRINVVGGKAAASMLRRNDNDFRANITAGGTMEMYTPTAEETSLAEKVCDIIGLDFGGVDILQSNDGPLICEVNSNAHFKSIYDCTGINIGERIREYVEKCMEQ